MKYSTKKLILLAEVNFVLLSILDPYEIQIHKLFSNPKLLHKFLQRIKIWIPRESKIQFNYNLNSL
jgi:hypothetical protein